MKEVIIGIKNQHITEEINDIGTYHIRLVAEQAKTFWDTVRPDAEQVEYILPDCATPATYQKSIDVFWCAASMPEDYYESLKTVWSVNKEQFSYLIYEIIFMEPCIEKTNTFINEDGDTIQEKYITFPDRPTWEEDIVGDDGNVIGINVMSVGRFSG